MKQKQNHHRLAAGIISLSSILHLKATDATIEVQPLSSGEYILTLDTPVTFESDFRVQDEVFIVIEGVRPSAWGALSRVTARSLGRISNSDVDVAFGISKDKENQFGILDARDLVISDPPDSYYFSTGLLKWSRNGTELDKFRLIIPPLPGDSLRA